MKNKQVKQMMANAFSGEWHNLNSRWKGQSGIGMRLCVFYGYVDGERTVAELTSKISLTANQLKSN